MNFAFSDAAREELCRDLPAFIPPMIEWDLITEHVEAAFDAQPLYTQNMLIQGGWPDGLTFEPFRTNEFGQVYLTVKFRDALFLELSVNRLYPGTKVALDEGNQLTP